MIHLGRLDLQNRALPHQFDQIALCLALLWTDCLHVNVGRDFHPVVHDAIMDVALREGIAPKRAHDVHTVEQAVHLVSEHVGVAILTKRAVGVDAQGVAMKPLSNASLCLKTCVIMRSDGDSRLATEFVQSFLRRYQPQHLPPNQLELSLSA